MQSSWHSTRGSGRALGAAQVGSTDGAGGASRAGSQCHYHTAIKPSSLKCLCSCRRAPSYGKMCLECLQPSCSRESLITLLPARDHPFSSSLQKEAILSQPCLSVPPISQKKFLRSQKILPLCSQNIIIFSFLIKSHSPSALRTCFG